jgi:TPP-dependent pyruvate/acetoin dehydrogenase alpha subunit
VTQQLPVLFIVEDNGLSILTTIEERRVWNITDLAAGFKLDNDQSQDDPKAIFSSVQDAAENCLSDNYPFLYNIFCCRHRWHCGTGTDGPPKWNRREIVRSELGKEADDIDIVAKHDVEDAWRLRL